MSERLIQLERELREAVAQRCYSGVQQAAAAFCEQAAAEWQALPPGDPAARRIFDGMDGLLEWARLMLCMSRASVAAELRRVRLTHRYLSPEGASVARLRLNA
jgi:hypothetical protein